MGFVLDAATAARYFQDNAGNLEVAGVAETSEPSTSRPMECGPAPSVPLTSDEVEGNFFDLFLTFIA